MTTVIVESLDNLQNRIIAGNHTIIADEIGHSHLKSKLLMNDPPI